MVMSASAVQISLTSQINIRKSRFYEGRHDMFVIIRTDVIIDSEKVKVIVAGMAWVLLVGGIDNGKGKASGADFVGIIVRVDMRNPA